MAKRKTSRVELRWEPYFCWLPINLNNPDGRPKLFWLRWIEKAVARPTGLSSSFLGDETVYYRAKL